MLARETRNNHDDTVEFKSPLETNRINDVNCAGINIMLY